MGVHLVNSLCRAHICWRCTGIFTENTIYEHMRSAHGTIYDNVPAAPQPPDFFGIAVDIEEQRELLRQVEARRAAALHNARPAWQQDYAGIFDGHQARDPARERMERLRLQRLREAERDRHLREQRLRREAEQRRREQEEQRGGGWGCTVM